MPWTVKFGDDCVVSFDDLMPEDFEAVAAAEGAGTGFFEVYTAPAATSARFFRILEKCAAKAGQPEPEPFASMGDFLHRVESMLDRAPDIEDKPFMNGNPQMPDAPEAGSTSGAPGDMDGLPTSSDSNESVTS